MIYRLLVLFWTTNYEKTDCDCWQLHTKVVWTIVMESLITFFFLDMYKYETSIHWQQTGPTTPLSYKLVQMDDKLKTHFCLHSVFPCLADCLRLTMHSLYIWHSSNVMLYSLMHITTNILLYLYTYMLWHAVNLITLQQFVRGICGRALCLWLWWWTYQHLPTQRNTAVNHLV